MKIIPEFSMEEAEAIGDIFDKQGISFERDASPASAKNKYGLYTYFFCVPDDRFEDAIQMIKSYYGFLDGPVEAVSGTCPACGATVTNVFECPECGLTLSFDQRDLMKN
ncbi:MAG: hypothetical protein IT583_00140, partial [Verrucomicrobia bacterium]|nr:hypothetical protein [Verrucomicrobiota bacterium]